MVRRRVAAYHPAVTTAVSATSHDVAQAPAGAGRGAGWWLPTLTLWNREWVRFLRQRHRVASAFLTPVILWVFLGVGMNHAFVIGQKASTSAHGSGVAAMGSVAGTHVSYLEYFFPGTLAFILLSTAIFSTITVIEDRREGFLQGVLVAPAPRVSIVLGKVFGGATVAILQTTVFLVFWPLVTGVHGPWSQILGNMAAAWGVLVVLAIQMTAMGLCIAWPMNSTAGFHAVMMVFLMPAWFLSGAVFPLTGAPWWLKGLMCINPLTYGQAALTQTLTGQPGVVGVPVDTLGAAAVALVLTVAIVLGAAAMVGRRGRGG